MIYFTADLHLGHANILSHTGRPFASVEEMDAALIQNWNRKVHRNDTVYILGDLIFRNAVPAEEYLEQLKGVKHLIIGNHDRDWMKRTDLAKYLATAQLMTEINDGRHRITLCHYPMMSWNRCNQGAFHIHGHIHNNRNDSYWPLLQQMPQALNAGVDINEFAPVTFDELVENNKRFKESEESTCSQEKPL